MYVLRIAGWSTISGPCRIADFSGRRMLTHNALHTMQACCVHVFFMRMVHGKEDKEPILHSELAKSNRVVTTSQKPWRVNSPWFNPNPSLLVQLPEHSYQKIHARGFIPEGSSQEILTRRFIPEDFHFYFENNRFIPEDSSLQVLKYSRWRWGNYHCWMISWGGTDAMSLGTGQNLSCSCRRHENAKAVGIFWLYFFWGNLLGLWESYEVLTGVSLQLNQAKIPPEGRATWVSTHPENWISGHLVIAAFGLIWSASQFFAWKVKNEELTADGSIRLLL